MENERLIWKKNHGGCGVDDLIKGLHLEDLR